MNQGRVPVAYTLFRAWLSEVDGLEHLP